MLLQITRSVLSPFGKIGFSPLASTVKLHNNTTRHSVSRKIPKCGISSNFRTQTTNHKKELNSLTFLPVSKKSNQFQGSVMLRCINSRREFNSWTSLPALMKSDPIQGSHKVIQTMCVSRKEFNSWTSLPALTKSDLIQGSYGVMQRRCISRKDHPFPELKDAELEEEFVRGSGPGGQSVNQTANCVVLKHLPTGIVVKCHESRSLERNRQRARERLEERLDLHLKGDNSYLSLCREEASVQRQRKKKKNKLRLELKKAFKEREGLD